MSTDIRTVQGNVYPKDIVIGRTGTISLFRCVCVDKCDVTSLCLLMLIGKYPQSDGGEGIHPDFKV